MMDFKALEEDMQKPIKASAYLAWVNLQFERIKACDTKEIDGFKICDHRVYKELTEEALPLALFAHFYFKNNSQVYIKHCIERKNRQVLTESYDAEVLDSAGHFAFPIKFLEVAYPHDGRNDTLVKEDDIIRILKTVKKKNANTGYLPQTALIVYFDDTQFCTQETCGYDDFELFKDGMQKKLQSKIDRFLLVAFVGISQTRYFELNH